MGFYEELSRVYDIVFPLNPAAQSFIEAFTPRGSKVLDLACGSGNYALALSEKGYEVYGLDLDNAMIDSLMKKARHKRLDIRVKAADMRDVRRVFNDKFNTIYCIGNSIVHLTDETHIKELLKVLHEMLLKDGFLLLQIINYDRILKYNIKSLPTIKYSEKGLSFTREYASSENKSIIYFNTKLSIVEDEITKIYENSIPLLPLQSESLINMLEDAGFKDINLYGDFKENPYIKDESYALVIKAAK